MLRRIILRCWTYKQDTLGVGFAESLLLLSDPSPQRLALDDSSAAEAEQLLEVSVMQSLLLLEPLDIFQQE